MHHPNRPWQHLNLLDELEGKKIAVLGDMLELGPYEKRGHEMVGVRAAEVVDELIVVGDRAQMIASVSAAVWITCAGNCRVG